MAECIICLEEFDQTGHNPFSLPCGMFFVPYTRAPLWLTCHLLCANCIPSMMTQEDVKCPECEQVFPLLYDMQSSVRKIFWPSSPDRPATNQDANTQLIRLKESNRDLLDKLSRLQSQIGELNDLKEALMNKTGEAKGLALEVEDLKRCLSAGRQRIQLAAGPSAVRVQHQLNSPPPLPIHQQPTAPNPASLYNPFEDPEQQRRPTGTGPIRSAGADVSGNRYDPYRGSSARIVGVGPRRTTSMSSHMTTTPGPHPSMQVGIPPMPSLRPTSAGHPQAYSQPVTPHATYLHQPTHSASPPPHPHQVQVRHSDPILAQQLVQRQYVMQSMQNQALDTLLNKMTVTAARACDMRQILGGVAPGSFWHGPNEQQQSPLSGPTSMLFDALTFEGVWTPAIPG
ncbi:hypothetical protein DL96DRAFT_1677304 [Flagelloscypha sp. PMI_526]|nr:hypothetical protein DL96DRAFT_1677304 [Flagelloscypha sp. PMI_526]